MIALQIENRGRGFLVDGKIPSNKIKIDFNTPEIRPIKENCNFRHLYGNIYEPSEPEVVLIKGKSPKMFCEIEIEQYVPKITTNTITATIEDYMYEFRDSEKVTIKPKI